MQKKIGLCAIKQQQNFVVKSVFTEKHLQNYKENCVLNTIISTVQKNLKSRSDSVKNFGIASSLKPILEKCKKNEINILYVVKKDVPCLLHASHEDIQVHFV